MTDTAFHRRVRQALLDRRHQSGHWEGHLSSSALSTATAVTAFAVAHKAGVAGASAERHCVRGIDWLLATQNEDGGWGDTRDSPSNISTTALVWAALRFSHSEQIAPAARRASEWLSRKAGSGEPAALAAALAHRYGNDRTFSVPILTMCAIAGRLGTADDAWRLIPQLPFEVAVLPRQLFSWMRLPVVSYALPALISMGLARHRQAPARSPLAIVRTQSANRVLRKLSGLQPRSGGFLEAVPLTSFVAMSLIAAGEPHHPAVSNGLAFLDGVARDDGSWPIDSNLATWVTTLAVNALARTGLTDLTEANRAALRDWLLDQQWRCRHPYTGAAAGGWAWTDLPGGVPDADDTAGALLALRHLASDSASTREAAARGVEWLLDLQNRDGGIPTFCRGWGTLTFDRSATDLTAHALRAWSAWNEHLPESLRRRVRNATARAVRYLARTQRADGAFLPLWFGNQCAPEEENPTFGTARVVSGLAAARLGGSLTDVSRRAASWLLAAQHLSGGWGGAPGVEPTIEETGAATEALSAGPCLDDRHQAAARRGLKWLHDSTNGGRDFPAAPLGLYFARLWYSEEMYPVVLCAAACGPNPPPSPADK